jgi:hypothetical protein
MTRAVLLPAGADPFLNAYWLRHYRTWAAEVDELHIAVCGALPDDVLAYTQNCVDAVPNATMHHFEERTRHGQVLTFLLEQTEADHILLMEDDAFVRAPGVIAEAFGVIERGEVDIVATPRDSFASANVIAAARKALGDEPRGLAFWPCFLFASRGCLGATDRVFDSTLWPVGSELLGTTLTEPGTADTFIWASYQLRAMGLSVSLRENHRIPEVIPDDAPWFHVGSLSSGHGWVWQTDMTPDRYTQEVEHWKGLPSGEAAKRMAWWQRAWDRWDGGVPEYHEAYEAGFRRFMADLGIGQGEVNHLRTGFDPLVTWDER